MAGTEEEKKEGSSPEDIESLLDKRAGLDKLFKEKFTRVLTVMFTDLKGSTSIAEAEGDLSTRLFLKKHNEILMPIIAKNKGVLVKTMGDGTMSYFESAQDAVRAATQIQREAEKYNVGEKPKTPLLIRIGLNTGPCIVEERDIFGDTVNVASRFESTSVPGEVHMSESTYEALSDKAEIFVRYLKTTKLKGKSEEFKVYKAYWDPSEAERELKKEAEPAPAPKPSNLKNIIIAAAVIIILGVLFAVYSMNKGGGAERETRSIEHATEIGGGGGK